jgi:hypothetical protein
MTCVPTNIISVSCIGRASRHIPRFSDFKHSIIFLFVSYLLRTDVWKQLPVHRRSIAHFLSKF